jgi:L-fuculose-phosphate aldolase
VLYIPPVTRAGLKRSEEEAARRQIVRVCHRMYERGMIAGTDGNVSVRLSQDRLLITPSGVHKGDLVEEDLVLTDREGAPVRPGRRPSSEILMHLLCYQLREDVGAVVHAHPVHAVALAVAGVSLANCILPESCLSLGFILTAPYSTPGTEEVPRALRDLITRADAILLDRHGSLTVGASLQTAYNRLESVEHTARITHAARCLGEVQPLPERQVEKLREVAAKYGWAKIPLGCDECNACPNGRAPSPSTEGGEVGAVIEAALARYLRS